MKGKLQGISILALFLGFGWVAFAEESPWSIRNGLRVHARFHDESGEAYRVTLLTRSRGRNEAAGVFETGSVLLLEGASTGRWIYETQSKGTLDFRGVTSTSSLRQVDGGSALKVTYTSEEGEGKGQFEIQTPNGIQRVLESEGGSQPPEETERLAQLSAPMKKVLLLLRALAHDKGSWHVDPRLLTPFFGRQDAGPRAALSVESLPVDCGFDASFGFPCAPDEAPKAQDNVFVKPLQ